MSQTGNKTKKSATKSKSADDKKNNTSADNETETTPVVCLTNDPTSKLMYYFDCICSVLNFDEENSFVKLRNYYKRDELTDEERLKLFIFCAVLEPRVLIDKCIFAQPGLCNGYGNRFIKRDSLEVKSLDPPKSIEVGGKTVTLTNEVMIFKQSWMMRNFIEPFAILACEIHENNRKNGKPEIVKYREDKEKSVSFGESSSDMNADSKNISSDKNETPKVPDSKEKTKSSTCTIL